MAKSRHRKGFKKRKAQNKLHLLNDRKELLRKHKAAMKKIMDEQEEIRAEQERIQFEKNKTLRTKAAIANAKARKDGNASDLLKEKDSDDAALANAMKTAKASTENAITAAGTLVAAIPAEHQEAFLGSKAAEYSDVQVEGAEGVPLGVDSGWPGPQKNVCVIYRLENKKMIGINIRNGKATFPIANQPK